MTGITIIIIILVPILFQVVRLSIKQEQRYRETQERLARIEEKLGRQF